MSDGKAYLRPAGLLWGRDANEAIEAGDAGRIAGANLAFTRVELSFRHEALVSRSWHSYPDLAASSDCEITDRLEKIAVPRPKIVAGVSGEPSLMGIVNVTPDSFSDGGEYHDPDSAIRHGRELARQGADILDVGGESTRPGSDPVAFDLELSRVLPVIEALTGEGFAVSVDTRKSQIMKQASAAGATLLNDVSALTHDPQSAPMAASLDLPVVLMHAQGDPKTMQKAPHYDDVALDVFDALENFVQRAVNAGINADRIIVDPGIGFGKTFAHNLDLLRRLSLFHGLGAPLMVGASRKAFIGALTGEKAAGRRAAGSLGAAVASAIQGAQILRVHDVGETRHALDVWRASAGLRQLAE